MFWDNPKIQSKVYNYINRVEKLDKKMQILTVDFDKSWWDIILQQKAMLIFMIVSEVLGSIFIALFPILIAYTLTNNDYKLFLIIVIAMIIDTWTHILATKYNNIMQIVAMKSVEYSANKFFLSVDPIYHSTKSSGQIVSKISRGANSYEDFLDLLGSELLTIFISVITVSVAMFSFNWHLGLVSSLFIILIGSFNVITNIARTAIFQSKWLKSEDRLKAVSIETLLQAPFIRAIFASNEQISKIKAVTKDHMIKLGNNWQAWQYINGFSRSLHILSVLVIGSIIFNQMQMNVFSPILAISILLTYTNGTQNILNIGQKIKRLTQSISSINDLFDFVRSFGKQTFPVLEENVILKKQN